MSTDITPYAASPLPERMEYARVLSSAADLIPRALFGKPIDGKPPEPSPGKVLLVLETGAMLGLHPIAALQGINIIEGKSSASAALMSGVIRGAGHRLSIVEQGTVEGGDYAVTATLTRREHNGLTREMETGDVFTSTWTPKRAARAGLCTYAQQENGTWAVTARSRGGEPLPWESYTESLCKARAVSEVGRDGAQDVLMGIRYTPEELGAVVDHTGEVVELPENTEPDTEPAAPSALPPARKRATKGTQGTKRAPAEEVKPTEAELDENAAAKAADPEAYLAAQQGPAEVLVNDGQTVTAHDAETGAQRVVRDLTGPQESEADRQWRLKHEREEAERAQAVMDAAKLKRAEEEAAAEMAEQEERERIAAEQEAAVLAREEANTVDVEPEPEADAQGVVVEPWDTEPDPFELASQEEPTNWTRRLAAASTVTQVRALWDEATTKGAMSTDLRLEIIKRKAHLEAPVPDPASAPE